MNWQCGWWSTHLNAKQPSQYSVSDNTKRRLKMMINQLMPRAHWAKNCWAPKTTPADEKKKSAKLRAWCAPSGLININIYANLGEMCEDAPSSRLGASSPPSMRLSPASCPPEKSKIWGSGSCGVRVVWSWKEAPERLPCPHLFGFRLEGKSWGENMAGDFGFGGTIWQEILLL